MKSLLRLLLKTQHQRNRFDPAQTEKGMTLVELLVGAVMAFLIITPMLGFVVDMLNTDRREQVKSNTEQDIQAAVDFIAQDLSQAIYIYDGAGITAISNPNQLPAAPQNTTGTPILVFWKRQQIKNAVPINSAIKPQKCDDVANVNKCNDTYVLSLVAYYQIKETDPKSIWCQPSGGTCPTRIARYEIRDGVRKPDPVAGDTNPPYYNVNDTKDTQQPDPAFNKDFDFTKPTEKVTLPAGLTKAKNPEVLVNYIDHSQGPVLSPCTTALGNPTDPKTKTALSEQTVKVTDPNTNSFYACVDTSKNLARVTIRGNSLRRLQTDANYDANKSAFFPTASVQVQGLGAVGK
ncbi:hormogonium polysaccharide secretion pseudopilin HpsC [Microcoleus sp. herbarium14]|uniref:hormogonium polysaccharide secretion pseudopilin HpsC n=1 Tax=Microcoleus sp. herbarium14 TaxID=3055439 RepID=UPI002FD0D0A4